MNYLVIKCGGSIIDELPSSFFSNLVLLQKEKDIKPIIVHGGGPMITRHLKQMNVKTSFVNGLRVTTKEVLDVVEMVLSGLVNKNIVRKMMNEKAKAIGMSGVDGHLLRATPIKEIDKYGYVGDISAVNIDLIKIMLEQNYIPVISPIAIGKDDQHYNINADVAASAIASSLHAPLCFVSDIPGICVNDKVLHLVNQTKIKQLINEEVIYGGMIPKVQSALKALELGAREVSIVNGMEDNALLNFINGEPVGTKIQLGEVSYV
ncbi:acetylglutamate kinase [Amphibacillus sp. MSJ-3]|uniref:acetylglutamate kinase n=1 Tax=Amphibacillus sp. MSJ-3 TaxID=2841505 RepID=UPI001C0EB13F|nr:acetylglutamate kinase [Amphibacillus sp. MSJ-3]MBU5595609.1 acetylglutamate kinase [Amphibacillus sp. MSJ-3]